MALWSAWNPYRRAALYPPPVEWGPMQAMDEPERVALICGICHFPMELDDVAIPGVLTSTCVRCYARETHTEHPMDKRLRDLWIRALGEFA
jgi:hypothetical protein